MAAGGGLFSLIWIVAMIAIFYFMLIRPQKKQEKKTKAMLAALQIGDKVVTVGGICGKITKLKDDVVYLETGFVGNPSERSTLKIERAAIKTVQTIHDDQV
ncbi:MAG: preprotein translocase subunit YajC [Clostridia bacterium]|nr:preprotein translocase subunit YajC [Clostridia bacterium]